MTALVAGWNAQKELSISCKTLAVWLCQ